MLPLGWSYQRGVICLPEKNLICKLKEDFV